MTAPTNPDAPNTPNTPDEPAPEPASAPAPEPASAPAPESEEVTADNAADILAADDEAPAPAASPGPSRRGLLIGVGLATGLPPAGEIAATLAEHGFIVNAPRPDTIRLAPPFILSDADADAFTGALSEVLARRLQRGAP